MVYSRLTSIPATVVRLSVMLTKLFYNIGLIYAWFALLTNEKQVGHQNQGRSQRLYHVEAHQTWRITNVRGV